jgi:hypothetical protein
LENSPKAFEKGPKPKENSPKPFGKSPKHLPNSPKHPQKSPKHFPNLFSQKYNHKVHLISLTF